MGIVIPLHQTKQAKAQGIFAQINIAARRLGFSENLAFRAAQKAKQQYLDGAGSPARVVSITRAGLRQQAEPVVA